MTTLIRTFFLMVVCFAFVSTAVNGDTFYRCAPVWRETAFVEMFTFSCPTGQVVNIQSALIGYSDYYSPPSEANPDGSCPWTSRTSNTCEAIGYGSCVSVGACSCNCTEEITSKIISDCTGKKTCNLKKYILYKTDGAPHLCVLTRHAHFVVVNYTCTTVIRPTSHPPNTIATTSYRSSTIATKSQESSSLFIVSNSSTFSTPSSTSSTQSSTFSTPSSTSSTPSSTSSSSSLSVSRVTATTSKTSSEFSIAANTTAIQQPLSSGAIAGIVIGSIVFALLIVAVLVVILCCYCGKRCINANSNDKKAVISDSPRDNTPHTATTEFNGGHLANDGENTCSRSTPTATYEEAAAFGAYSVLPANKINSSLTGSKPPNGTTGNSVKQTAYTDVIKKPNGHTDNAYVIGGEVDAAQQNEQNEWQQRIEKKKQEKQTNAQTRLKAGNEPSPRSVVSLYPSSDLKLHPGSATAGSERLDSYVGSNNTLVLVDNSLYGLGSATVEHEDSSLSLTLVDNEVYGVPNLEQC